MTDAYSEDVKLLRSLGLSTDDFGIEWTDLGTVQHHDHATIRVLVSAWPAQFWRFEINREHDVVGGGREDVVVETGSGSFRDYWPSVLHVANNCFTITRHGDAQFEIDELATLESALTDAADYRRDDGGDCSDCSRLDAPCEDHAEDDALADQYDALLNKIQGGNNA